MTNFAPVAGLVGGALIGLAAVVMMLTIGQIAGVAGIVLNAMTTRDPADRSWRLAFILGLPLGALLGDRGRSEGLEQREFSGEQC